MANAVPKPEHEDMSSNHTSISIDMLYTDMYICPCTHMCMYIHIRSDDVHVHVCLRINIHTLSTYTIIVFRTLFDGEGFTMMAVDLERVFSWPVGA